jgi:hypothetical protein
MKMKMIKSGDRTIVVDVRGQMSEITNLCISEEASFAKGMIDKYGMVAMKDSSGPLMTPHEVVDRAFEIARLTFEHIRVYDMDSPFPFNEVFGEKTE